MEKVYAGYAGHSIDAIRKAMENHMNTRDDSACRRDEIDVGRYGRLREQYLFRSRHNLYMKLQMTGELQAHLSEIDRMADCITDELTRTLRRERRIPEAAEENVVQWEIHMDGIHRQVEEVILTQLIYL